VGDYGTITVSRRDASIGGLGGAWLLAEASGSCASSDREEVLSGSILCTFHMEKIGANLAQFLTNQRGFRSNSQQGKTNINVETEAALFVEAIDQLR
jgi:hypothetical protein